MADIWMDARFPGNCSECGERIYVEDRIVYSTDEKKAYCKECGQEVAGPDPGRAA